MDDADAHLGHENKKELHVVEGALSPKKETQNDQKIFAQVYKNESLLHRISFDSLMTSKPTV